MPDFFPSLLGQTSGAQGGKGFYEYRNGHSVQANSAVLALRVGDDKAGLTREELRRRMVS